MMRRLPLKFQNIAYFKRLPPLCVENVAHVDIQCHSLRITLH